MKNPKPKKSGATRVGNPYEIIKAANFPMTHISIGSWKSRRRGGMIAKFYFGRKKIIWEFLDGNLKNKMEMQWSHITAISAVTPPDQPGLLKIELGRPPSFFVETMPLPRLHTNWDKTSDFTGGQAQIHRIHYVTFPPRELDKPLQNLLESDKNLSELFDKAFPIEDTLFHVCSDVNFGQPSLLQPPPCYCNMPTYPSPPYYPNSYPPPSPPNFITAAVVNFPPMDVNQQMGVNDRHQTALVNKNNYGWQETVHGNPLSNSIQNTYHVMDPNSHGSLHQCVQNGSGDVGNPATMMQNGSGGVDDPQNGSGRADTCPYQSAAAMVQNGSNMIDILPPYEMLQHGSNMVDGMLQNGSGGADTCPFRLVHNPAAMMQHGSNMIDIVPHNGMLQNGSGKADTCPFRRADNPAAMMQNMIYILPHKGMLQNGSGKADSWPYRRDNPTAMMQNMTDILPPYEMLQNGSCGLDKSKVMVQNGGARTENPTTMDSAMLQIGNIMTHNLGQLEQNKNKGRGDDDDDGGDWLLPHINGTVKPI